MATGDVNLAAGSLTHARGISGSVPGLVVRSSSLAGQVHVAVEVVTRDARHARIASTDRVRGRRSRKPSRSRLRSHRTEHGQRWRHVGGGAPQSRASRRPRNVYRRPFCVTEPVTVTVYVTVGRERGPSTRIVHAGRRGTFEASPTTRSAPPHPARYPAPRSSPTAPLDTADRSQTPARWHLRVHRSTARADQ